MVPLPVTITSPSGCRFYVAIPSTSMPQMHMKRPRTTLFTAPNHLRLHCPANAEENVLKNPLYFHSHRPRSPSRIHIWEPTSPLIALRIERCSTFCLIGLLLLGLASLLQRSLAARIGFIDSQVSGYPPRHGPSWVAFLSLMMPPNSSKNILPCSFAVSIREFAQKKYKDGIAEIKSAKELKFMTLKRESTPQHSANSESARHPFSSVGYIVEYENSGTPCIQLAVTKEGSPTNNNK